MLLKFTNVSILSFTQCDANNTFSRWDYAPRWIMLFINSESSWEKSFFLVIRLAYLHNWLDCVQANSGRAAKLSFYFHPPVCLMFLLHQIFIHLRSIFIHTSREKHTSSSLSFHERQMVFALHCDWEDGKAKQTSARKVIHTRSNVAGWLACLPGGARGACTCVWRWTFCGF